MSSLPPCQDKLINSHYWCSDFFFFLLIWKKKKINLNKVILSENSMEAKVDLLERRVPRGIVAKLCNYNTTHWQSVNNNKLKKKINNFALLLNDLLKKRFICEWNREELLIMIGQYCGVFSGLHLFTALLSCCSVTEGKLCKLLPPNWKKTMTERLFWLQLTQSENVRSLLFRPC